MSDCLHTWEEAHDKQRGKLVGSKIETSKLRRQIVMSDHMKHNIHYLNGIVTLLKARLEERTSQKYNPALDKLARRQVIRESLLCGFMLPIWLRDGEVFGETGIALDLYPICDLSFRKFLFADPRPGSSYSSGNSSLKSGYFFQPADTTKSCFSVATPAHFQLRSVAV